MKKFFVIVAMLLAGFSASAQINIGAGYMWDFWAQKNGSSKAGSRSMSGVYAGVSYNIQIVEGLGLAPGAYFSWATGIDLDKNGDKCKETVNGKEVSLSSTHMALTIPVHITYSMDLGPGKAFAYLGPAFQYGLSLTESCKPKELQDALNLLLPEEAKVGRNMFKKYDNDGHRYMNPFDVKLGVGFGYNWKFIQANVGFDWGFLNRAKTKDYTGDYKENANAVHAGIAFVF